MSQTREERPVTSGTPQEQAGKTWSSAYGLGRQNAAAHPMGPRSSRLIPDDLDLETATRAPAWCPPGGCRAWTRSSFETVAALAFEAGRNYERAAAAELAEFDRTWRPVHRSWAEQVAERVARLGPSVQMRYDDAGWPPVAVPGGGGVRLGGPEHIGRPW